MLEHLKRIFKAVENLELLLTVWKAQYTIFETAANLGVDGSDNFEGVPNTEYDEMTILHSADQAGTIEIYMGSDTIGLWLVDSIPYIIDEVVSKVYNRTGEKIKVLFQNGGVAQTSRGSLVMLRRA